MHIWLVAAAEAGSNSGTWKEALERADVIVHATVTGVTSCTNTSEANAWTFVSLQVHETLLGGWNGSPGRPEDELTIRLLGGPLPGGLQTGLGGTPILSVNDEIAVVLKYRDDGGAALTPFASGGASVYRFISRGANNPRVVISGAGQGLVSGPHGLIEYVRFASGMAYMGLHDAIDLQELGDEIDGYYAVLPPPPANNGAWSGAWAGAAHLRVEEAVTDTKGACTANLKGTVDSGVLNATGRCNLPYIGAARLQVDATWASETWTGTVTVETDDDQLGSRTSSLIVVGANSDALRAYASGGEEADGAEFEAETHMILEYSGDRPLLMQAQFLDWLRAHIDAKDLSGGVGNSIRESPGTCNATVNPQAPIHVE